MKKVISFILSMCLMIQCVAFAAEVSSTGEVEVTFSGDVEYSTETVSNSNYTTLKSVGTITVGGEFTHYTVGTSDIDSTVYVVDGIDIKSVGSKDKITSNTSYIHMAEPVKSTVFVTVFNGDAVLGSKVFDIECKLIDERDIVSPTRIKIGNSNLEGFDANVFEYTFNVPSVDYDTTIRVDADTADEYRILEDGNTSYIVMFNRDKTKNSIYKINFNYDFVDSLDIEIQDTAETNELVNFVAKYNGTDVTNIVNVSLDSAYGYLENSGRIHLIKAGLVELNFTLGNASISKSVNVSGQDIIDVPQHNLTVDEIDKYVVGDIHKIKMSSSVFANDTRFTMVSELDTIKIIDKYIVVVKSGDVKLNITHPVKGDLVKKITSSINYTDTSLDTIPSISNMNLTTNSMDGVECKIGGVYNRQLRIGIDSGDSIEVHADKVIGLKRGKSTVKISSNTAERVIDVNVVTPDVVVPTGIEVVNTSSDFVLNKESIFEVKVIPEGATLDVADVAVSSSKKAKIRSLGGLKYGITPEETGEHTITAKISKYSMEKSILVSASTSGDVVNPDNPDVERVPVEKIVLENTYISLEVGDTKTIKVKNITPASATNKEVRYESMDTRYATIDNNGRVTGERAGTAKINVYSVSNPEVYATCTINVYDEDDRYDSDDKYRYPVDKVVIYREDNGKEVAIRNGKTDVMVSTEQQFVARIYPYNATNQEVRWYTSNSNIAEVDEDGMLTAYRVGEVELRVVTRDGNHRDSIKVEITEWMLKPTSIKIVNIDNSEVNTEVKTGDKLALKVNFEPLLTTERDVIWTITEGFHLFTLSKTGDVEFKEVGKATIKVYTKDYSTYTTLTFNITYSDDYWKDIGSTKNMSPRKAIEVKFSEALSISNIQNGNIFVATTRDGNTKAENVIMELVDGNRVLRVSSLSGEWEPEETYYLLIKGASKSESGIQLIKNCRYTFETRKGRQSAK